MQEYQYPPNDTEPNRRRSRTALRSFLMIIIAGLIMLLAMLLLSTLVNPATPEANTPPTQAANDATQTPESPQPAVVPEGSNSQDGSANPQTVQETGNQFINTSGSSSGLLGQLGQDTLSDFQTCADELEYTARIETVWDIWELIFFTIYTNQDNASTTPPACQQLASEYASSGRAEFMTALGADWWPDGTFPTELYFPADTICISYENCKDQCAIAIGFSSEEFNEYVLYQQLLNNNIKEMPLSCVGFEAELFLNALGNDPQSTSNLMACTNELVPTSMCHRDYRELISECSEAIDWLGEPDELEKIIKSEFVSNYGDIPTRCIEYVSLRLLSASAYTHTDFGINKGAGCITGSRDCLATYPISLTFESAQACAALLDWPTPITSNSGAIELVEYLAASAPWLPPGSMPLACTQLMLSASPTEAGRAYWELLGKTLSERRIDTAP